MEPIRLTLTVNKQAYCPVCGIELRHFSFRFCCGVAFCSACVRVVDAGAIIDNADSIRRFAAARDLADTYGLLWWTPRQRPVHSAQELHRAGHDGFNREPRQHREAVANLDDAPPHK